MFQPLLFWFIIVIQVLLIVWLCVMVIRLLLMFTKWKDQKLPFVPSSRKVKRMMVLSSVLDNADVIVDLGSGTGALLSMVRSRYPTSRLRGVEKRRDLVWISRARFAFTTSEPRPKIHHGDMFNHNIDDADAIIGYWITDLMPDLLKKFEKECKEGCIIMSNTFSFPPSDQIEYLDTIEQGKTKVHVYRKAAL